MKNSCVDCELFKTPNVMEFTPQDTGKFPRSNHDNLLKVQYYIFYVNRCRLPGSMFITHEIFNNIVTRITKMHQVTAFYCHF